METKDLIDRIEYHLRAAKGGSKITDAEAGEELQVSKQTVGRWINNVGAMRVVQLAALLKVYGADADEVVSQSLDEVRRGRA